MNERLAAVFSMAVAVLAVPGTPLYAADSGAERSDSLALASSAADKEKDEGGWKRDGFGFKSGDFQFHLKGYAQYDFRSFDWQVKETELGRLRAKNHEWRRTRIGFEAEWGKWTAEFVADPRLVFPDSSLKDAVLQFRASKKLVLEAGHFKPPSSQEFLTSAGKTDFVERSMVGAILVPDREWGGAASGEVSKYTYALGVFRGDGGYLPEKAGTSVALRGTRSIKKDFYVGASFMQGNVKPDPRVGSKEPSPKGVLGRVPSGFVFWRRAHVNGARQRMGAELGFTRGPVRIIAEALDMREDRKGQGSTGQDIPDSLARGWSVTASWLVTGEKKVTTIKPKKTLVNGGPGAIELLARIEGLKVDDVGDPSGFAGFGNRARNIAPSGARTISAGFNWWFAPYLRFQGDIQADRYNDPTIAPQPGRRGTYLTYVGRIQFALP